MSAWEKYYKVKQIVNQEKIDITEYIKSLYKSVKDHKPNWKRDKGHRSAFHENGFQT